MPRIASVLLPMPLPEAFDYAEPEGLDLAIGDHVTVALGPRVIRGVVTGLRDGTGGNRPLKPVLERVDDPPLPPGVLGFVEWAARYSVDVPGWPLAMALRGLRHPAAKPDKALILTGAQPARMTPARLKVLAAAEQGPMASGALAAAAGVSAGVVKGMVDEGVLAVTWVEPDTRFPQPDLSRPPQTLNPSQQASADVLAQMLAAGGFQAALLDGVTGSG
jgi:primosomal protein N' (replication factor Y)